MDYAIRMPANKSVELEIEDLLFRPPGRPSRKPLVRYKSFRYQAKSWTTPRRIVAKVEHHRGELFPRVGFIVTNMALPIRSVVRFYNKCGTAEQWIKEGKQATHWTRLSCHRFRANEVRLQLSVLAYNLGALWRRLVLPPRVKRWSLTSLQQRSVGHVVNGLKVPSVGLVDRERIETRGSDDMVGQQRSSLARRGQDRDVRPTSHVNGRLMAATTDAGAQSIAASGSRLSSTRRPPSVTSRTASGPSASALRQTASACARRRRSPISSAAWSPVAKVSTI